MKAPRKYKIEALPAKLQREIEAWIDAHQGRFLNKLSDELKARGIAIGAGALARYARLMERRTRHDRVERIVALNVTTTPRAIAEIKEMARKRGIKLD